ncbi:MAG: hypothetical protein LBK26_02220 [Rickettsiales bacterium]|jgi:Sec-independent protein translocase protein TatA|nr:hypothetical protein [Rickettsiales bacterium]
MLGISGAEFLIILIVAAAVIPARNWPDVARAIARAVKTVREIIWKITDATEEIKERIERDAPIDKLTQKTMDDVMSAFVSPKAKQTRTKGKAKKDK